MKKRTDGRYQKTITLGTDENGKLIRKTIYSKTQKGLKDKEDELKDSLKRGTRISTRMTFQEAMELWIENRDIKATTLKTYQSTCKNLTPIYDIPVCELKAIHLKDCLAKAKASARVNALIIAKGTMDMLIAEEIIDRNPFKLIKYKRTTKKPKRALTEDEQQLLLNAPASQNKVVCLLMLLCGLRIGEALAITRRDIDYKTKMLTVNKQMADNGNIVSVKTATSNRTVPVPERLIKEIQKLDSIAIVPRLDVAHRGQILGRYMHKLGIGKDVTPHYLRHTYATLLFNSGVPVKVAQSYLGHASASITMDIYTHLEAEQLTEGADKIEVYLSKHFV